MKCIIIGAGEFNEKVIEKNSDDLLIVADGGYYNYLKLENNKDLFIDILIGDFDSLDLQKVNIDNRTKILKLYPVKDDTDVLDAVKYALDMGYNEFYIYGALGKRVEHSIANIGVLSYIKDHNANGFLFDDKKVIRVVKNERIILDSKYNGYISIFSMYEKSSGVTVKNLRYELNNYDLYENYPLGIDNEFIGKSASIEVKKGKLLVIYHKD